MQPTEFVDYDLAVAIHDDLIGTFGGSLGIRDLGLLESALSQPLASFFGELLHPTIDTQAAAYLYHIVKNHPFIDGNKRTALGVTIAFLGMNDCELNFSEQELYDLVLDVATNKLEKQELAAKLKEHIVSSSSG